MKEKTKTWLALAESDLEFAGDVVSSGKRPHYAVHFCHQAIEKILKAIVEDFLVQLSPHYLASKYPEDIQTYYKEYTLQKNGCPELRRSFNGSEIN